MSRVVWLLDVEADGFHLRASTRPIAILDAAGDRQVYPGGLPDPEITTSAARGPTGRSVAVQVLPPPGQSWADIMLRGLELEGAEATIRRWTEGQTWEEAPRRVVGFVHDVEWGRGPGPLEVSIKAPPWGDGTRVIPETYAVDDTTHPVQTTAEYETDPAVIGSLPAVVIGTPGDVVYRYTAKEALSPDDTAVAGPPVKPLTRTRVWADLVEGAPALLTDFFPYLADGRLSRLAWACHQVVAEQVVILDATEKRWDVFDVQHALDLQGQTYAYVDWGDGKFVNGRIGHAYFVILLDEEGYGGGLAVQGPDGQKKAATGLGEVLTWMLAKMGTPRATGLQRAQEQELNAFQLQTVINTGITVWQWVTDQVTSVFPVRFVEDTDGGYLAPYPLVAQDGASVDDLDPDRDGLEVVGRPRRDTGQIANHLVLTYARGTKQAVLTNSSSAARGERFDRWCARSQAKRWGRITWEESSEVIADDDTAWAALRAKARELAMPIETIIIQTSTARLDELGLLSRVELDVTAWGMPAGQYAVEERTELGDLVRITFRHLPREV